MVHTAYKDFAEVEVEYLEGLRQVWSEKTEKTRSESTMPRMLTALFLTFEAAVLNKISHLKVDMGYQGKEYSVPVSSSVALINHLGKALAFIEYIQGFIAEDDFIEEFEMSPSDIEVTLLSLKELIADVKSKGIKSQEIDTQYQLSQNSDATYRQLLNSPYIWNAYNDNI